MLKKLRLPRSERGEGEAIIAILFAWVIMLIIFVGSAIHDSVKMNRFDKSFDRKEITFGSNLIPLSNIGHPATGGLPEYIPLGDSESPLDDHPRLYEVTECLSLSLPEGSKGVRVFTPYFSPEQVLITVPPLQSGNMNICVPEGITVQVVLWSEQ